MLQVISHIKFKGSVWKIISYRECHTVFKFQQLVLQA